MTTQTQTQNNSFYFCFRSRSFVHSILSLSRCVLSCIFFLFTVKEDRIVYKVVPLSLQVVSIPSLVRCWYVRVFVPPLVCVFYINS